MDKLIPMKIKQFKNKKMKNITPILISILIITMYIIGFVYAYKKSSIYYSKQRMSYVKDSLEVEILKYRLDYIKKMENGK